MNKPSYFFSSESVTEGHPDKICDQISDSVLDAVLKDDPTGRVAIETLVTTGMVLVSGELTTKTYVDIPKLVRSTLHRIGYKEAELGFDFESCGVLTAIQQQSPDIALGVDSGGAGDQGLMFGYACRETPELMPLPIMLAHRITAELAALRHSGKLKYLCPDGKSQVTVEYQDDVAKRVDTIVISTHHKSYVTNKQIKQDMIRLIVKNPKLIPQDLVDAKTKILVNPTGRFEVGGPVADTGLTGRKIIVDTYGGAAPHGGGAFSGKDPTKVDRSATYMARYIAKNVVASGLADRCEIQLAYAIGVADPVSVRVNAFGTAKVPQVALEKAIRETFDLTPKGIIQMLDLRKPIYARTAANGHFGRPGFSWEKTDKAKDLRLKVKAVLERNGHAAEQRN